jgi:cobaltochelatase CobT
MRLRPEATDSVATAVLRSLSARMHVDVAADAPRSEIDSRAVRARFSDARVHSLLEDRFMESKEWLDLFEQARAESKLPDGWRGVRSNLARRARDNVEQVQSAHGAAICELLVEVRRAMGAPWPSGDHTAGDNSGEAAALAALRDDQQAFGEAVAQLLESPGVEAKRANPFTDVQKQCNRSPRPVTAQLAASELSTHVASLRAARAVPRGVVVPQAIQVPESSPPYHVYSSEHDRVVEAAEVCDAGRRASLLRQLQAAQGDTPGHIARWAHRLQRYLQARQRRYWQFDLEDGVLDSARLARLVADPMQTLLFKQEFMADFPGTAVAVLIDNSGSMRGEPISTAAASALLIGSVLERCGIKTELLGFTTARWRGGRSRAAWAAAGKPAHPGRVTDLLHVVYKHASQSWRRSKANIAMMLDENLLKENVDGEAVLWAHRRLLRRSEPRRILMVISDGAPLDEATLAENDGGYLDRHLRHVIDGIEKGSSVDLFAIGIGHDVSAYYSNAFTVAGPENLGEAMVAGLMDCLRHSSRRQICAPRTCSPRSFRGTAARSKSKGCAW